MSKRSAIAVPEDEHHRHTKRQKIASIGKLTDRAEEIVSARQLQTLLTFQQDAVSQLRSGIQSFKTFLESIVYPTDNDAVPRQREILKGYLDTQKPKDITDKDAVFLADLAQTWSFAAQANNDHLVSAVTAILALLLKTLSGHLDFREYGILLCRTVLQTSQAKLLSRGLSAPRQKEHVISPCLRLLTEVVSFDTGAVARQLFSKRDYLLDSKILARNLGLRKISTDGSIEDRRKPSVRSNAVRYLLANFKYQSEGAKIEILKQGNVLGALFGGIKEDSPELAKEILNVIKRHIILDDAIPKSSKSHVLTERNLASIAGLCRLGQLEEVSQEQQHQPVESVAHDFLLLVCTSAGLGALIPSSSWYPPGSDKDTGPTDTEDDQGLNDELGLESLEWFGRYTTRVPIRNTVLAAFAQGLRPYANNLERELLLSIFKAAPELVADYFFKKTHFPFDPKLTMTWIGYSSFLFETVRLPVLAYFGRKDSYSDVPPPLSIVLESILPQPLNQKVLTRCLNHSSDLITYFAIRLTIVAFQKLQRVLQTFKEASNAHSLIWEQASTRLAADFCQRCPKMKDVVAAFRRIPEENLMQREAVTRLLALYYEIVPQVALEEKFDVSVALTNALVRTGKLENATEENEMRLLELSHLVQIAHHSPSMQWWRKPESLRFSPFTSLIKLVATTSVERSTRQIAELLVSIVRDNDILQLQTEPSSLDALVASLGNFSEETVSTDPVFDFLDNCFGLAVRRPIKYQDDLDLLVGNLPDAPSPDDMGSVSLLLLAIKEQWPHAAKAHVNNTHTIAKWIARFLTALKEVGEDVRVLTAILADLMENEVTSEAECKEMRDALRLDEVLAPAIPSLTKLAQEDTKDYSAEFGTSPREKFDGVSIGIEELPQENENHPGLNCWSHKEVEEAVEEGDMGELLLCLCSKHVGIRRQALGNIQKLVAKIENSTYAEWEQIDLLLGELIETAKSVIDERPLPYIAGVFASRAVSVLADPTHVLYPKINKFLNKGPSWNIDRLPSYWAEKIIFNPPDEDDAYYRELDWLLDYLLDALRTPEDMDTLRARNIFERVLALYSSPYCSQTRKEKILRLLFRAADVQGSTTLITRSGILGWLQAEISLNDRYESTLRRLVSRLYSTCHVERVKEWSGGGAERFVERLAITV